MKKRKRETRGEETGAGAAKEETFFTVLNRMYKKL